MPKKKSNFSAFQKEKTTRELQREYYIQSILFMKKQMETMGLIKEQLTKLEKRK